MPAQEDPHSTLEVAARHFAEGQPELGPHARHLHDRSEDKYVVQHATGKPDVHVSASRHTPEARSQTGLRRRKVCIWMCVATLLVLLAVGLGVGLGVSQERQR